MQLSPVRQIKQILRASDIVVQGHTQFKLFKQFFDAFLPKRWRLYVYFMKFHVFSE